MAERKSGSSLKNIVLGAAVIVPMMAGTLYLGSLKPNLPEYILLKINGQTYEEMLEMRKDNHVENLFNKYDSNGDSTITRTEVMESLE